MTATKSPGAVAALGASVTDQLGRQVFSETNRQKQLSQVPIRATLLGLDRCEAEGIRARGYAPVLDLCRELVAAGFNPSSSLEAWRGETLCLRVHSIGEGARLTVADDRHGTPRLRRQQERAQGYVAGSPVAQIGGGRKKDTPATGGSPARRHTAGHRGKSTCGDALDGAARAARPRAADSGTSDTRQSIKRNQVPLSPHQWEFGDIIGQLEHETTA